MKPLRELDTTELLRRYEIHVPSPVREEHGHRAAIEISCDQGDAPQIALRCNDLRVMRLLPLSVFEAVAMVDMLQECGVALSTKEQTMLVRLLTRAARLYSEAGLDRLALDPVFILSDDYRIGAARFYAKGAHHVRRRLEPGAHDAGAVFPYRRHQPLLK